MTGSNSINYMQYSMPWMNTGYSFSGNSFYYPSFQGGMYTPMNWHDMNSVWNGYGITPQTTFTSAQTATQEEELTVNITDEQRAAMIEENKEQLAEQNQATHGSAMGAIGGTALFAVPALSKGINITRNQPVTEMFFTRKGVELWESHPTTMTEAQKVMQKSEKQFQKELRKLKKIHGANQEALHEAEKALTKQYRDYTKSMQDAIKSGNPEQVAQMTQHYKAGNGKWWQRAPKMAKKTVRYRASKIDAIRKANEAAAAGKQVATRAVAGNSFRHHLGGGMGVAAGGVFGLINFFSEPEKAKRDEARKLAEETGDKSVYRKQVAQSLARSVLPMVGWTFGDAAGRWMYNKAITENASKIAQNLGEKGTGNIVAKAATGKKPGFFKRVGNFFSKGAKFIGKCAKGVGSVFRAGGGIKKICSGLFKGVGKALGKVAGKVLGKISGKAIGAAIGSLIPGLGTVIGLAVGALADWAISKYVVPKIFGENDAVDEKKMELASNEELVAQAYVNQVNGVEVSSEAQAAIANNPTFCAKFHEQLLAEQQAQGYIA